MKADSERQASAPSEASSLDDSDCLLGEIDELLECWQNRLTIHNLALAERYLKGELRLMIDGVRLSRSGLDDVEWRAILQGIGSIGRSKRERRKFERRVLPGNLHSRNKDDVGVGGPYRNDRLVFIQSVKLVDDPEKFAPSLVWLQSPDEPVGPCTNALYFSRSVGFKFVDRSTDWKARSSSRLELIDEDQLPGELVKRGSEVVDHIANYAAERCRNRLTYLDAVDQIASLRIVVSDDDIWVSAVKRDDFRLKVTDVAFGPFNLDAYAT